jgi:hypothetical protein
MKRERVKQLMQDVDDLYAKIIMEMVGIKNSPKIQATILQPWNRSPLRARLQSAATKLPDDKEPFIRGLLEKLPQQIRSVLRDWIKESSDGIGGRPAGFTDKERREILNAIRTLRESGGLKRAAAIKRVADQWQTTATKIEGILKHQNRYKDV